jgi:hypothetical protein
MICGPLASMMMQRGMLECDECNWTGRSVAAGEVHRRGCVPYQLQTLKESHSFHRVADGNAIVCNGTAHTTGCTPQRCMWETTVETILLPKYDEDPAVRRFMDEVRTEMGMFPLRQTKTTELMCRLMRRSEGLQRAWVPDVNYAAEAIMAYHATTAAVVVPRLDVLLVVDILMDNSDLVEHMKNIPAEALRGCVGAMNSMRMSLQSPSVAEAFLTAWAANKLPLDVVYGWDGGWVAAALSTRVLLAEAVALSATIMPLPVSPYVPIPLLVLFSGAE